MAVGFDLDVPLNSRIRSHVGTEGCSAPKAESFGAHQSR